MHFSSILHSVLYFCDFTEFPSRQACHVHHGPWHPRVHSIVIRQITFPGGTISHDYMWPLTPSPSYPCSFNFSHLLISACQSFMNKHLYPIFLCLSVSQPFSEFDLLFFRCVSLSGSILPNFCFSMFCLSVTQPFSEFWSFIFQVCQSVRITFSQFLFFIFFCLSVGQPFSKFSKFSSFVFLVCQSVRINFTQFSFFIFLSVSQSVNHFQNYELASGAATAVVSVTWCHCKDRPNPKLICKTWARKAHIEPNWAVDPI